MRPGPAAVEVNGRHVPTQCLLVVSDRRFVSWGVGAAGPTSTCSRRRTANAGVVMMMMAGAWTCAIS
jgi:hypothetical protein